MAHHLRAQDALVENLDLNLSSHVVAHNHL